MQVTTDSEDVLVLEDPSRRVAGGIIIAMGVLWLIVVVPLAVQQNGIFVGLIMLPGAGLIGVWGILILRRSRAVFDAQKRRLDVKLGTSRVVDWIVPFEDLEEFYLLRSQADDGGPESFLPFVGTPQGDVQLTSIVLDRDAAEAARDAAVAFLRRHGVDITAPAKPRNWPGWTTRPRAYEI